VMKDRFWLYWGIYTGIILTVNIVLVFFFPQNTAFHIAMIFPAVCLWRLLYEGWYVRVRFISTVILPDTKDPDEIACELGWEKRDFCANPPLMFERIFSTTSLYIGPWALSFLLFAPGFYKMLSLLLVIPPFAIAFAAITIYNRKYSKQHRKQAQKVREEQEKREELGRWK